MSSWTNDERNKIAGAEELEIAPVRSDGTLRKSVPIWVVRAGDDLYVRSYRGPGGAWFALRSVAMLVTSAPAGVEKDVTFILNETDSRINDQIDAAYRAKYGRYPQYVAPMLTADVRTTTIKLIPRSKTEE